MADIDDVRRSTNDADLDAAAYQARFDALAAQGVDIHGEATLVRSFNPTSVLDAGCGTGRIAIELARHDIDVIGVDIDASMLDQARQRSPELEFLHADLAGLRLDRTFDVVLLAGNVPLFCAVERREDLIRSSAVHVRPGGVLIIGFQLHRGFDLEVLDSVAAQAHLTPVERWSTWTGDAFEATSDYAVSIFEREFDVIAT